MLPEITLSSRGLHSLVPATARIFKEDMTIDAHQIRGFVTCNVQESQRLSQIDEMVDYNFPEYKKADVLRHISLIIDYTSITRYEEYDRLKGVTINFEKIKSIADDATCERMQIVRNEGLNTTEFFIDDFLLASSSMILDDSSTFM